ncbi:hypothetical protein OYC64_019352 [Pagothenia borchgrevinki]|uniref:Uncharacterized protein n=1 Tax=Pagothenia borchgrevinki TaxID=8213 RepID=A0ABD2FIE3_PAGBO
MILILTLVSVLGVCVCDPAPPGWAEPLDCVRASELCNQKPQCSSQFRIMRQCLSGGGPRAQYHAGVQRVPRGAGGPEGLHAVRLSLQEGHEEGAAVPSELLEHPHGAHGG